MAKVDEAIEELTDEVSAVNTKYEGLAKDVAAIKEALTKMAEAAQKPVPPPTLSQSVVNNVISGAIGDYFKTHPVGKTFTEEDKVSLTDAVYSKFNEASLNYAERRKEYDDKVEKEQLEKRRAQGFETQEQIAEWAPEFPEDIRCWMRFIGAKSIGLESAPEFAHDKLRCIGNLFMAANGLAKPTFKGYIKHKWQEFKTRTDKWGWFKWYMVFLCIMAIILMHGQYQSRVMKLEQVNHIFYRHIMSDPVKAKEYHDIDSLVNAQPVLKKLWKVDP